MTKKEMKEYMPNFAGKKVVNFKKVLTFKRPNDQKKRMLRVQIDKNDSIYDVRPRVFHGIDLYNKYHGRPSKFVDEMVNLAISSYDRD